MSHVYAVTPDHPLCGIWTAQDQEGSWDYEWTEYTISVVEERFHVSGIDPRDGEEFIIYDVGYDGESIRFVSRMPSTGRTGRNWMRIVDKDKSRISVYLHGDGNLGKKTVSSEDSFT